MPGVFMHLDLERLKCTLVKDGGGVQIGLRSDLTGIRVSSAALIPPEGKWEVNRVLDGFRDETQRFIETYFGDEESFEGRIIDYEEVLEEIV